ncbi:protein kinase [Kitasatospora indigofera]|uniref:protein kinase domain-containing protein n=1 Tax=Kitasatospora indigofera TaxID=67307 RepID=UPI00369C2EFB
MAVSDRRGWDMKPGDVIAGRYELVNRLGRGGMGEVWAGRDRDLRRTVALKLLMTGEDVATDLPARFAREAVAAARINHPNVITLYERGFHEDVLYLAMEKVDGSTLTDVISRESPMPFPRALSIAGDIAAALAAAHRAGVVHYDITPRNVMLTTDERVKVLDFGIAGFLHTAFSLVRSTLLTPAGTVEYGAPEQFRTERGDERSDLYGLGGVLFTMLTGRPPFTGPNAWAVMARKQEEDAPGLRTLRADAPAELAALVAQLLARDPGRRPSSAQQVHERLRQLRTGPGPAFGIRLLHTARPDGTPPGTDDPYHHVRVFLDGTAGDLDQVTKVVYHLHPTFPEPERLITARSTNFALEMSAWGQFTLTADVFTADSPTPRRLERYISF